MNGSHQLKILSALLLTITTTQAFSYDFIQELREGHPILQLGGYQGHQGNAQRVNISGLIGDYFTVTKDNDINGLAGIGYFIDGQETKSFRMTYGINAFYLGETTVKGTVIQEDLFTNLSYDYSIEHYPVYLMAKSIIPTKFANEEVTLDVGIGPNFMVTGWLNEYSLDNGITIPDRIFSNNTSTTFSATAGLAVRFNKLFNSSSLECGYRFFYLGEGRLNPLSNQVINVLHTGNVYANALTCGITV